jgi:hypothetical protein
MLAQKKAQPGEGGAKLCVRVCHRAFRTGAHLTSSRMTRSSQVGANEAHKASLLRAAFLNSLLPPFRWTKARLP